MDKDSRHTPWDEEVAHYERKQLVREKERNADLQEMIGELYKKKKAMKIQIEKLTLVARTAIGTDKLEEIMEEPIDYGYNNPKKCVVYDEFPGKVQTSLPKAYEFLKAQKLPSDSPWPERTLYADEEQDPEDREIPPLLERETPSSWVQQKSSWGKKSSEEKEKVETPMPTLIPAGEIIDCFSKEEAALIDECVKAENEDIAQAMQQALDETGYQPTTQEKALLEMIAKDPQGWNRK
jgi:hypothetical protein